MHITLSLSLVFAANAAPLPNFAFETGRLSNWEGSGFSLTAANGRGPSPTFAICSSDCGPVGRVALLHRTFIVPPGVGVIRFHAAAFRAKNQQPDAHLDVQLEAAGRVYFPRRIRTTDGWHPSNELLSPDSNGRLHEYEWNVEAYVGQRVRIAIIDQDSRPGCFVVCSGFHFLSLDEINGKEFAAEMLKLTREHEHDLGPMERFDSKHFMAITDAADEYMEERLYNCEMIYALFFDHFQAKGFTVRPPPGKLMVAAFGTQAGFEAYLGTHMPAAVTGIYHRISNRLVIYDYGTNPALLAAVRAGRAQADKIAGGLTRQRVLGTFNRYIREHRDDTNVGTIMHEVAHQLSFNGGMLNREGDVACWLAEGLATYCESTAGGAWQGIGEPNPQRVTALVAPAHGQAVFLPLRDLVGDDAWLRQAKNTGEVLQGYAQSWALFRFLMEERPQSLRKFLEMIYLRRTPEHRLEDFVECFGDLTKLEPRYQAYMKQLVREEERPAPGPVLAGPPVTPQRPASK